MERSATGQVPSLGRLSRLHLLVFGIVLAALVCIGATFLVPHALDDPPAVWRLLLLAMVVIAGDMAVLHLRFGRDQYTFTWSEASVVIGLVLVPWPWLTLVAPASVALAHLVARRNPVKVAFNAASITVGATLARGVCALIVGDRQVQDTSSLTTVAALVAAACVYFVWNSVTVSAAIALSSNLPFRDVVRNGLLLKVAVLLGNTLVALLLVTAQWGGTTAVFIPFSVVLLYLSYHGYLRALKERDVWRQLNGAAKELSRLDELEVATAAVGRATQLFKAERAEVALFNPKLDYVIVVCRAPDGVISLRKEPAYDQVLAADSAGSVRVTHLGGPEQNWTVAPLEGVGGSMGSLRLGFHQTTAISERDQQVLSTFTHGVTTSLQNARLYGEMRTQAEVNEHEATHDSLTGLANRNLLRQRLAGALAEVDKDRTSVGLLLLDLDHFKEINDTLGHSAGDDLLRGIAERLIGCLRPHDLVARLGGDEFAILLCGLPSGADADTVAKGLLRQLSEPIDHEGLRLVVEGSIGVASYPEDGTSSEELLRRADVAMYQAKESRASFAHYRVDRDASSVSRLTLAAELRNAIPDGELVVHYQPQVDLVSGEVVGAEALARWQHPVRGLLGPVDFIDVAEHSGLVRDFTLHIMDRAVAECAVWRATGLDVDVSVNLSARNLLHRDLPSDVAEILERHGLPAHQLILEITETTMMSELEVVEEVLAGVRRLGVQLSVDDFGTGYSSLAFLQRIAVNEIKVDRSFISVLTSSQSDAAIVRATIELAHSLGLRVVAEGVETTDQLAALRALGCDLGQGWHFGRPGPGVATRDLLARAGRRQLAHGGLSLVRQQVSGA